MRTFLGALLVVTLIVSGDGETMLEDSVLLPCACSERNLHEEFRWQKEEPNGSLVFKTNPAISNFDSKYTGRAKIFLSENRDNCSVLLTNVTVDDQGKYRCSFRKQEEYQYFFVDLNVSACYTVCQTPQSGSGNDRQCYVKKRYRETEIQWIVGGQLLTESNTTKINKIYTMDSSTGLYHFNITRMRTVEPTCHTNSIPTNIPGDQERNKRDPDSARYRYLTTIPILLVLGLSLLLWRRWDSQSSQRI
ncbi:uncharacterized protein LOC114564519 isoform X2 [Perca flavescens]|uniref:uncharacterized protein LOC114564519 isoform X2 n=1 Tax=Perca flavescens TaxID=8167 RepID=UPI00106EC9FF|nr:uncharacterized protein LOC114564519 isoform X2 [Perca flavescens]